MAKTPNTVKSAKSPKTLPAKTVALSGTATLPAVSAKVDPPVEKPAEQSVEQPVKKVYTKPTSVKADPTLHGHIDNLKAPY